MRIRTEGLYRLWVTVGVPTAGNYKDSDLIAVRSHLTAIRLLGLLKNGWAAVIFQGRHQAILELVKSIGGATRCDDHITPHQTGQQLEVRREIENMLSVDEETAYLLFRLYVEMGDTITVKPNNCGVAQIPLLDEPAAETPAPV